MTITSDTKVVDLDLSPSICKALIAHFDCPMYPYPPLVSDVVLLGGKGLLGIRGIGPKKKNKITSMLVKAKVMPVNEL